MWKTHNKLLSVDVFQTAIEVFNEILSASSFLNLYSPKAPQPSASPLRHNVEAEQLHLLLKRMDHVCVYLGYEAIKHFHLNVNLNEKCFPVRVKYQEFMYEFSHWIKWPSIYLWELMPDWINALITVFESSILICD